MKIEDYYTLEVNKVLYKLSKSKFRSRFHLTSKDILYIQSKCFDEIKKHAYDFISKRLASYPTLNDGKQTPMRGHPVFVAQHATATCCRGCLYKWHHISKDKELTKDDINYIVMVIMRWIDNEVKK